MLADAESMCCGIHGAKMQNDAPFVCVSEREGVKPEGKEISVSPPPSILLGGRIR